MSSFDDSNHATLPDNRRSVSDIAIALGWNAIGLVPRGGLHRCLSTKNTRHVLREEEAIIVLNKSNCAVPIIEDSQSVIKMVKHSRQALRRVLFASSTVRAEDQLADALSETLLNALKDWMVQLLFCVMSVCLARERINRVG